MLVSFIIIAHNEEKNLKNLLEDLNGQTYPKKLIEVILIDSISSDNTKNVMNEFRNSNKEFNKIIIKSTVK
ncbi:MAG: glycosyltransferase [Clostridium perfringens]